MGRVDERGIPLNVKTYGDGFRKLAGWIAVSLLALMAGGLLVTYELLVLNVEDGDFRDMLYDYRITSFGIRHQHKHLVNSQYCCHEDPVVFKYRCDASEVTRYSSEPPHCPPVIQFSCSYLNGQACNNTRAIIYKAAGLDMKGQPSNCKRAGRVRLRAVQNSANTRTVLVLWKGERQEESFVLPSDFCLGWLWSISLNGFLFEF